MAFLSPPAHAGPVASLESLLEEMIDYGAIARWPQPEFTCSQASSYDRGTVAPDQPGWFANSDQNQFIRNRDPRAGVMDCHAGSVQPAPAFVLGAFEPSDGRFTLRSEVSGTNPASVGAKFYWGLDCVILE